MASQNLPPPSNFPSSMGPGAKPMQPGEGPGSIIKELQEIRSSYSINIDSDSLRLAYNFRGQNRRYDLPFVSIPVSDTSRWLLYGGTRRARVTGLFTLDMIRGAENMAGRPLTQAEAEGFAYHTGKRMKYNYTGTIIGFTAGYLIAARTWKTMKFPFMKTKPIESYNYFPAKGLPILSGRASQLMWQITRANLYAAISLIFAQTVLGSMGDSVMTVGLYRDVRTQEVVKAMKGSFDRIRMNRSQPGQAAPLPQQQQGHDQDPQSVDFYGNEGRSAQDYGSGRTDYATDQAFSDQTTDTGVLSDRSMRARERQREGERNPYSSPLPSSKQSSQQADSSFFFDDASPTAGNDPDMATPGPNVSKSSGSAWDRIRRGGSSRVPSTSQSSQQQESSKPVESGGGWRRQSAQSYPNRMDDFSFSKNDEERQLAKEQAQRDFDAMLERERRESDSDGYAGSSLAAGTGSETPPTSAGSAWDRRRRGGSQ